MLTTLGTVVCPRDTMIVTVDPTSTDSPDVGLVLMT